MGFQDERGRIRWKMHFNSPREKVYNALATDAGRAMFWAESATESGGTLDFTFLNEPYSFQGKILEQRPSEVFAIEYFASRVTFTLNDDGSGGTDLYLLAEDVDEQWRMEMTAGWVSVLMSMKAAVDFNVDLRNHDPARTWTQGYADN